ncbi:MAG: protein kinase family protein [Candidatus Omnitrophota bacterium]
MRNRIYQYEPLWGEWKIDELIDEGSFGKVYKVKRTEFGEDYFAAVKIISILQSETEIKHVYSEGMDEQFVKTYFENFVSGFLKEIRLMSSLKRNTNIVSLENYKIVEKKDSIGWNILIRMELLKSFMDYMTEKTLSKRDIIKLGIDMCKALELCQKANIIYRDIKPDNIFVSPCGNFKLGDFGIARQVEKTTSGLSKKGPLPIWHPRLQGRSL